MLLAPITYTVLYIFVMIAVAFTYRNGLLRMGMNLKLVKKRLRSASNHFWSLCHLPMVDWRIWSFIGF